MGSLQIRGYVHEVFLVPDRSGSTRVVWSSAYPELFRFGARSLSEAEFARVSAGLRREPGRLIPNNPVDSQQLLIGALLIGQASSPGVSHHAFGSGDPSWDVALPPHDPDQTTLETEFERRAPKTRTFLDALGGTPQLAPSRFQRFTTELGSAEFVGVSFREHALFGGAGADEVDGGFMVNWFRSAEIVKPAVGWRRIVDTEIGG